MNDYNGLEWKWPNWANPFHWAGWAIDKVTFGHHPHFNPRVTCFRVPESWQPWVAVAAAIGATIFIPGLGATVLSAGKSTGSFILKAGKETYGFIKGASSIVKSAATGGAVIGKLFKKPSGEIEFKGVEEYDPSALSMDKQDWQKALLTWVPTILIIGVASSLFIKESTKEK